MRIQHNIMAMNAYRNYKNNVSAMKKNLEKLSSGYKINRAGDDAAGLAISEKMRAQITGLETAQKNAKDGISLVQTAEGALTEVHDMLNRMVTLATQSANGTYDNETDRAQMQKELDQLRSEIDRIADSTNFNGINLLDGSLEASAKTYSVSGSDMTILAKASTVVGAAGTSTLVHVDSSKAVATKFYVELDNVAFTSTGADNSAKLTVGDKTLSFKLNANETLTGAALADRIATTTGQDEVLIGNVSYSVTTDGSKLVFTMTDDALKSVTIAASYSGNLDVSVIKGKCVQQGTVDLATQRIQEGSPFQAGILANTLTTAYSDTDIVDGKTMSIGGVNYVFASNQETIDAVKAAGSNFKVVDISDIVDKDGALDDTKVGHGSALSEALSRLTVVAKDNEMFTVGVTDDYMLAFQEKSTYSGGADLSTFDGVQAQLQEGTFTVTTNKPAKGNGTGLQLQIGDTADDFNQLTVSVKDCHVASIGGNGQTISNISIADQQSAQSAVDVIKSAINYISDVRGTLGATQNRLDHTINNLSVMTENIQDAESTIRDTDVAEEMMAYTKNNILIQSAQAMLAQANQVPQGVLQLLQ